jgi:hypothetical protein
LTSQVHQRFMLCLASTIWITSIVQSLLDHGDNPRFLLPLKQNLLLHNILIENIIIIGACEIK